MKTIQYLCLFSLLIGLTSCGLFQKQPQKIDSVNPPESKEANSVSPLESFDSDSVTLESKESDSVDFPKQSCGDSLPPDESVYPVEVYIVFIPSNKNNLELIKEKYCRQVFGTEKRDEGLEFVIQVASLIGRDRAEEFKNVLSRDFQDVKISEPTIIDAQSKSESDVSVVASHLEFNERLDSSLEIGMAALLNDNQIQTLLTIDRTQAFYSSERYPIKVVLPTYIPKGFELVNFGTIELVPTDGVNRKGSQYFLQYKKTDNTCFTFVGGAKEGLGGSAAFAITVNANSPALGEVTLVNIAPDRTNNNSDYINFQNVWEDRDFGAFSLSSSTYSHEKGSCKAMSLVEAVKVSESFQFLQPNVNN